MISLTTMMWIGWIFLWPGKVAMDAESVLSQVMLKEEEK